MGYNNAIIVWYDGVFINWEWEWEQECGNEIHKLVYFKNREGEWQ